MIHYDDIILHIERNGTLIPVYISAGYSPETAARPTSIRSFIETGDPGDPGDPEEIEIYAVCLEDGSPIELTHEETQEAEDEVRKHCESEEMSPYDGWQENFNR